MTKNNKFGFTLLELLIVVLIIGILAAIALPQYYYLINLAKVKSRMGILKDIAQAQERYYLVNGIYAETNQNINGQEGETIKMLDIDLPNIPDITYHFDQTSVILFNTRTDIRVGYAWEAKHDIPAKNFFCYYNNKMYGNSVLSVDTKEKICQKVCNNEIQSNFPVENHTGCVIK